ncbi:MAG TPA: hypothetical protein VIJ16_08880 [Gemmatimonadaceae bacterium]
MMARTMRRLLPLALLCIASTLPAQSAADASARLGPQFMSYNIKAPVNQKISEFAVPLYVLIPATDALSFDVGTAWAHATVTSPGSPTSTLSGLTDTQIRANYAIGTDFIVLTAGLNLPTGKSGALPNEQPAATRIASDFLVFPITGFGTGAGGTGGIALAHPFGDWNAGFGLAMRHSVAYNPFQDSTGNKLRFQPGDEYRARIGLDHPFGTGRISVGLTYSKFGNDQANATVYNSGDRYISQATITNSLNGVDITIAGWDLLRAAGQLADTTHTGLENIGNGGVAFGFHTASGLTIEPSVNERVWTQLSPSGSTASAPNISFMTMVGLRFNYDMGSYAITPYVGYATGQIGGTGGINGISDNGANSHLTGFNASLAIRLGGY